MRSSRRVDRSPRALVSLALLGVGFLVVPFVGLGTKVSWGSFASLVSTPEVRSALWLSLVTSVVAAVLACIIGIPLAWVLARGRWRGRTIVRSLVLVPLVVPPVVAGVALLAAFGRTDGLLGGPIYDVFGVQFTFSSVGVVLAQTFVALPFLALSAEAAFASLDVRSLDVAATSGAGPWRRMRLVVAAQCSPALVAGFAVAWARALGEFGATITFAGNIEGRTRTVPLAVYALLESDPPAAYALSALLLAVCIGVLVVLRGRWIGGLRP